MGEIQADLMIPDRKPAIIMPYESARSDRVVNFVVEVTKGSRHFTAF